MAFLENLAFVFVAGFITALATGVGALPFFFFDSISDRRNVILWGLASGIMLSASVFGLVEEGLAEGTPLELLTGMGAGVLLVVVAHHVLLDSDIDPHEYEEADFKKLVLILGILTVHSFPEGIAIGVSFADIGLEGGTQIFGVVIPLLGIFMTIAISIHNIPEGTAISIPLKAMGVPNWKMVWWAVFSSLPQPIGAVIAFTFVRVAREFLPFGFGFAAGAMIYLVLTEFIPEALDTGTELPGGGKRELATGIIIGVIIMIPLAFV
ncbi:zinc transporter ZupT [Halalkalicoccus paucihalophilus]|uniref:Zinc transporter ZupT n=1 Tax=Halalkalicoccus paucihalophilus TaxID=1008153 RepID=A0A151A812_9EURY|nr:ZIP family metal transporter [Halalkalicoccus paucihalophilus]KYH23775.1 zinc transporter ZupT [Halalkalicoccus paucihalophilus]